MEQQKEERLEKFEWMLAAVESEHQKTLDPMAVLREKGRTKSATYYQLMASKMTYQNMLTMYAVWGLRDALPGEAAKK